MKWNDKEQDDYSCAFYDLIKDLFVHTGGVRKHSLAASN